MTRGELNTIIKKIQNECCLESPTRLTYFWNEKNQAVFKLFFDSLYIPEDLVLGNEDILNTFSRQDAYLYEDDFKIDEVNTNEGYLTFIPSIQNFKTISRYKDAKEAKDLTKDKPEDKKECFLVVGKHLNETFSKFSNFILQEEDDDDSGTKGTTEDSSTEEVDSEVTEKDSEETQEGEADEADPEKDSEETQEGENKDDATEEVLGSPDAEQMDSIQKKADEKSEKPHSQNVPSLQCFSLPAPLTTKGSQAIRDMLTSITSSDTGDEKIKKLVCFDISTDSELIETAENGFMVFSNIAKSILGGETWAYSANGSKASLSQKIDAMEDGGTIAYLDKASQALVQKNNIGGIKSLQVTEVSESNEDNQKTNLEEFNSIAQIVKQILTEYRAECKKWGGSPRPKGETKDHSTGGDAKSSGLQDAEGGEGKGAQEVESPNEGQEANQGANEDGLANASTTDKDKPAEGQENNNQEQKPEDNNNNQEDGSDNNEQKPEEGNNSENGEEAQDQNSKEGQENNNPEQQDPNAKPEENGQGQNGEEKPEEGQEGGSEEGTADVDSTKDVAMQGTASKAEIDKAVEEWDKKSEAFNKDQNNPEVFYALAYCRDFYIKDMNGVEQADFEQVKDWKKKFADFQAKVKKGDLNIGSFSDLTKLDRIKLSVAAGVDQANQLARDSLGAKRMDNATGNNDSMFASTNTQYGTNASVDTKDGQGVEKKELESNGNAYPEYFNVYCYNNKNFPKLREFFKGNAELKALTGSKKG